jgi:broad specificity phosphatase PhoE
MQKTTVYLDPAVALALREISRGEGRSQAELIREALHQYTRNRARPRLAGVGTFHSGRTDVSSRAEELLRTAAGRKK